MTLLSTLASIGMAVGPPLVYADQLLSILRRRDSSGFSIDVCGVLLLANITRIVFWLGERFELALLIQSLLMIAFQLLLLFTCLRFSPTHQPLPQSPSQAAFSLPLRDSLDEPLPPVPSTPGAQGGRRPGNFWQWPTFGHYLAFLGAWTAVLLGLWVVLGSYGWFVALLGYIALGLESTLPIPQLISNYQRKSLAGFRYSVLAGWLGGDSFKTVYFFLQQSPLQFKVCSIFQLSIDFVILAQAIICRSATRRDAVAGAGKADAEAADEEVRALRGDLEAAGPR